MCANISAVSPPPLYIPISLRIYCFLLCLLFFFSLHSFSHCSIDWITQSPFNVVRKSEDLNATVFASFHWKKKSHPECTCTTCLSSESRAFAALIRVSLAAIFYVWCAPFAGSRRWNFWWRFQPYQQIYIQIHAAIQTATRRAQILDLYIKCRLG